MNRYRRMRLLFVVSALCLAYSVPAHSEPESIEEVRLFFGRDIGIDKKCGALHVSDDMWSNFVAQQIARRFDGFTVLDAAGYWQGGKEDSKIVIFTFRADREAAAKLDDTVVIAESYAEKFCQDSVMQVYQNKDGRLLRQFISGNL